MSERASATDAALAAERAEADATAVAFANSERHVSELLSACVIKDDTINKQAVELDDAKAYQATLLQRIKELEAQIAPPLTFGVASHQLTFRDSIYANDAEMYALMDDLGNNVIRDLAPMAGDTTPIMLEHHKRGRQHHLTVGRWQDVGKYDWAKFLTRMRTVADCVVEFAGVNEPDGEGRSRDVWLPQVKAHQTLLYDKVKADPVLKDKPVGLGALRWVNQNKWADNAEMVKACAGKFDFFNLHFYPGKGSDVYAELDAAVLEVRKFTDKPIVLSECGGSTAKMPLAEQARICRDLVLAGRAHPDVTRVIIYEAVDDVDGSDRHTDQDLTPGDDKFPDDERGALQANFGAYESDKVAVTGFKRKPAADALRGLVK